MELSFLFTDVEGSSRLWETEPGAMESALAQHDEIIRLAVEAEGGTVVKGTGDGFMAAFPSPINAVTAAVTAQLALQRHDFDVVDGLPVRMGIHLGESQPRAGDYFGPVVNRAARLMAIGHGGQILVSATSQAATADRLPAPIRLHSLGEHRLKDLTAPEQVFQVLHPELRTEFPPLDSLDVFSNNLPSMLQSFVGREGRHRQDHRNAGDRSSGDTHRVRRIGQDPPRCGSRRQEHRPFPLGGVARRSRPGH